jgi:hypothetical protein
LPGIGNWGIVESAKKVIAPFLFYITSLPRPHGD